MEETNTTGPGPVSVPVSAELSDYDKGIRDDNILTVRLQQLVAVGLWIWQGVGGKSGNLQRCQTANKAPLHINNARSP